MSPTTERQPFLGQPYSDDPSAEKHVPQDRHVRQARTNKLLSHILVFIVTSFLWVIVMLIILPSSKHRTTSGRYGSHDPTERHNITTNAKLLECGDSWQEAKSRGCKYDILMNNWIPAPCADNEWIEEYQEDSSWGAFADKNLTQKLTVKEMSERDFYYTSIRDHINHCAIMWKKQFWIFYEDRPAFDTVIASPGHTEHCAQYLTDVSEKVYWSDPTKTEMGFAGCWVRE